ncbi:hypothetical protein NDU88_010013 [Pleurodeles waltl]|uniref:Uncharacterized protein n=1 Tax=Pleurodeles waltl TaxID=8319 RepID=A0AAV7RZD5_PLEWA|nr:hypothetical protein NDU88_010013 [Pleurodeles waltl]
MRIVKFTGSPLRGAAALLYTGHGTLRRIARHMELEMPVRVCKAIAVWVMCYKCSRALFVLQAVKRDLSSDLKEVQRDLDKVGERVATLKCKEDGYSEEIEWLQQEILRLQKLQIDIQSHTEDLENCLQWNNIRIKGVPTAAEGIDLGGYVEALFGFILGDAMNLEMKLDQLHRLELRTSR